MLCWCWLAVSVLRFRWDAQQRLMTRLLTRLYDKAEESADQVQDMETLAALLAPCGGPPPALLAALQAVIAAEGLDGELRVGACSGWGLGGDPADAPLSSLLGQLCT